jgi:hypothetical protein
VEAEASYRVAAMVLPKRHRWLWGIVAGVLALALIVVAALVIHENESSKAETTPTADEQAANGPLVGDPTLIASEQSCVKDNPNPPWFATIAAFEVHDSARTHLYGCAHFLGSTTSPNNVLAYKSTELYPTPYNIVTKGPDNLFIYGGGYGDSSTASGSFVASVEPGTLNQRWRRVLINTNATDEWDYPGVLNVLEDGSLVVIYGYHIAKLDPVTGGVEASTALPTGKSAPRDTSYNGYDAPPPESACRYQPDGERFVPPARIERLPPGKASVPIPELRAARSSRCPAVRRGV